MRDFAIASMIGLWFAFFIGRQAYHSAYIRLAVRALRGFRTYEADFGCECPECLGTARVPWRYRLNQPPFVYADED